MKKIFLMVFFASFTLFSFAQHTEIKEVANNITDFSLDNYGNLYAISGNSLSKFNSNGEKLSSFTRFEWGEISSINVQNPMKIMVFYQESGIILFLDENLNPLSEEINLFDNQYNTISLAAYSTANKIYLFDPTNQDLILMDFYFREISRTHIPFSNFNPTQIYTIKESFIAMQLPEQGIFIFDSFGNFDRKIAILTPHPILFQESEISYIEKEKWIHYYFQTLQKEEEEINLPHKNIIRIMQFQNKRFVLEGNGTLTSISSF